MTDQDDIEWLKMIQGVIERMSRESANVKTWSAGLLAGLTVLTRLSQQPRIILWSVPAFAILAVLDCYYLGAERAYRSLYGGVVRMLSAQNPPPQRLPRWTMAAGTTGRPWKQFAAWTRGGWGPTIILFYGALIGVVILVAVVPGANNGH